VQYISVEKIPVSLTLKELIKHVDCKHTRLRQFV